MTPEQRIDLDRVRALWATAPTSSGIGTISALVWFVVFYDQEGLATMLLIASIVIANQAVRVLLAKRYAREEADPARAALWARRYTWTMISGGLIWGAVSVYLFRSDDAARQVFILVCAYGNTAGATAPNAYHPPAMLWFIFATLVPVMGRVMMEPGLVYGFVNFALLMQLVFMSLFGLNMNKLLLASIRTRYENTRLVGELQEKTEALEHASQAKSQFFAAASHDLRQPLHALGYYTSLLKPTPVDVPHVERIEQCIGSLDDLLEGVLDISRLDAGRVKPQVGPVPVGELLRRLASLYEGAAAAKGLRLRVHAPALWALSDAALLDRVVANLLANALRYTERGGVLLAVRRAAGGLRLQVVDTGIGIADEALGRIFDEFVQLDNPERDPARGVGLGLATVRRLCVLMDHAVTVRSVPGRGSCFELRLPEAEAPAALAAPPEAAADHAPLRGRVLVVEDHELVRESLAATLAGWGLQCDSAVDGPAALALAAQHGYDAVLCDWRLPAPLDGTQVLAAIRALQPRVALTALLTGETETSLGTVPAGMPVLRKPIRPIRLRALLSAHLAARS